MEEPDISLKLRYLFHLKIACEKMSSLIYVAISVFSGTFAVFSVLVIMSRMKIYFLIAVKIHTLPHLQLSLFISE